LPGDAWWVPASWAYPDAVVELPNYPLKACPTSGVVQTVLLWGLVGEALDATQDEAVDPTHRASQEHRTPIR
jgi:hypothetical protein